MRCNQFIGLKSEANAWLNQNCVHDNIEVYVNGVKRSSQWVIRDVEGKHTINYAFDEGSEILPAHIMNNGKKIYEKVQCAPWSSGPMFFVYLVDENDNPIPESMWTEEEMSGY